MKIKIISDGTDEGTQVVNAETGERIECIQSISWELNPALCGSAVAVLRVVNTEIEAVAERTDRPAFWGRHVPSPLSEMIRELRKQREVG